MHAFAVTSKKNGKLQSRQLLASDMWLGRKTTAFYNTVMIRFSLALTVLKFSKGPFTSALGDGVDGIFHL